MILLCPGIIMNMKSFYIVVGFCGFNSFLLNMVTVIFMKLIRETSLVLFVIDSPLSNPGTLSFSFILYFLISSQNKQFPPVNFLYFITLLSTTTFLFSSALLHSVLFLCRDLRWTMILIGEKIVL